MAGGLEVLGAFAAAGQLLEQSNKIVHEILRAAKDLKDVPVKTKKLIEEVEHAERVLNNIKLPVGKPQVLSPAFLEPVLEELRSTLQQVKIKVDKFKLEDEKRESKNQPLELVKNVFHSGGSKQKMKAEELSSELQKSLDKLQGALNVENHGNIISLRGCVAEIPKGINLVHADLSLGIAKQFEVSKNNSVMLEKIVEITKILSIQEYSSGTYEAFPAKTDNPLVCQLHKAADFDEDTESRVDVIVEFKAGQKWEVLEGEPAEVATEGPKAGETRSSSFGGYRVQDGVSLRFTMSGDEERFFHFVTYSCSQPGAEPQLYFPIKSKTAHNIKAGRHMKRVFPNRSLYKKDPPRFALVKDGTSTFSSESVFLIFSRQSLVSAEAESKTSVVNLKISDVVEQLDQHLAKKLEDGADYDEIIVKHHKFDIFKD